MCFRALGRSGCLAGICFAGRCQQPQLYAIRPLAAIVTLQVLAVLAVLASGTKEYRETLKLVPFVDVTDAPLSKAKSERYGEGSAGELGPWKLDRVPVLRTFA